MLNEFRCLDGNELTHTPCHHSHRGLPVAQDFFNRRHVLVGELLDHFDGPEVFFELAGLGSTEKYGGDIWILHAPRESKLGNRRIKVLFGKGLKLCDFIERSGCFVAIEHTYQEAIAWLRKARAFWNAIVVLTGENT